MSRRVLRGGSCLKRGLLCRVLEKWECISVFKLALKGGTCCHEYFTIFNDV